MGAADEARAALWLAQRELRVAKRAEIETALAGDPVAAAAAQANFQPLINARLQAEMPEQPQDVESEVVINHNLNL
jgi:hypothetical protein